MNQTNHPYRVRLHGGRNVHAARHVNGSTDQATACGYFLPEESTDHRLDDRTAVTCRGCQRAMGGAR